MISGSRTQADRSYFRYQVDAATEAMTTDYATSPLKEPSSTIGEGLLQFGLGLAKTRDYLEPAALIAAALLMAAALLIPAGRAAAKCARPSWISQ